MAPVRREIGFEPDVLAAAERLAGGDLSAFVNEAVRRALPAAGPPSTLAACRAAFVEALAARDARRARSVVEEAVAGGLAIADVYVDVLTPVLHDVGHRWAIEEITVAHEHFVTAIVQALLPALAVHGQRKPTDGRLAVVAGTPGELHGIALQMVTDLLERDGWEVLAAGALDAGGGSRDARAQRVPRPRRALDHDGGTAAGPGRDARPAGGARPAAH